MNYIFLSAWTLSTMFGLRGFMSQKSDTADGRLAPYEQFTLHLTLKS